MKSNRLSGFFWIAIVAIFVMAVPFTIEAQEEGQLWTLATVQVHHDMIQEFEELQKELAAAYKKAGATTRLVSQVVRGPSNEYYIAEPVAKYADLDSDDFMVKALGEAGAARWVARVTKCVLNRRVDTLQARPDLSIQSEDGREVKLAVVTTRWNLPGRYPEYNEWLTNEWMPAVKQAGMNGYFTFRNVFGGNSREWITYALVDDWAAFDSAHPVRRTVGEEKWVELMGASGALTSYSTRKVLRLRPDLGVAADSSS